MNAFAVLREVVLVAAVEELVAAALEERHVRVHPGAVLSEQGLRHEGRVVAVPGRDLLHDQAVRDRVVGHRERVRVAHVDLVLRGADLVVVVLDRDPDRLERVDRVVAHLGGRVLRRHREVAALVDRLRAPVVLEEEVLELGTDVERVEAHAPASARARFRSAKRGSPSYGEPSGVTTSQIIRATFAPIACPCSSSGRGMSWKLAGSGIATMSDSSIALKPVIDEPSKPIPSFSASFISEGVIANDLSAPRDR